MARDVVNAICAAFPGAELTDPWGGGHDCWKVGGKMFAVVGAVLQGVSVKTDGVETAEMLTPPGWRSGRPTSTDPGSACPRAARRTS